MSTTTPAGAFCLVNLVLVSAASTVLAADQKVISKEIGKRAQALIESKQAAGLAIGLIHNGQRQVFGFGRATDNSDQPPNSQTVFEIGSITKTFTSILLAQMVAKGEVRLDDPVASLLPKSVSVPQWEGQPITLRNLATHTASLPGAPADLTLKALFGGEAFMANPFKGLTEEDVYRSLSTFRLTRKPGEKYFYSNQGMGLLGHALARHRNKSYEALVEEEITIPLKMHDTKIKGDPAWTARFALGHDASGKPTVPWEMTALEGAGALRSTLDDMLVYLAAQLNPDSTPFAEAIKLSHQRHFTVDPKSMSLGLAWHIDERTKVIWHNGGTIGFHSYIGFHPERKIGVVVLANTEAFIVDKLGIDLLSLSAQEADASEKKDQGK